MSGRGRTVTWCFAGSTAIYGTLLWLGPQYAIDIPVADRPLLTVLALYTAAFVAYFIALRAAIAMPTSRRFAGTIVVSSVVLRALLLPTPPFQEIDIYRYLWDGAVVVAGVNPYEVAPQSVIDAIAGDATDASLAEKLTQLAAEQPPLGEIVRTIHYSELPSPYPPVSQAVFAAAAATTPKGWSAFVRLVWLKAWLTAFDVATLLIVVGLLARLKKPIGWAIAYGWCPLVLKEVAGSGHLDAIATFFTTASVAWGVLAVTGANGSRHALVSSVLLGLGVGAKLYPIILAPWLAAGLLVRFGWRSTLGCAAAFLLACVGTLWPMLGASTTSPPAQATTAPLESAADLANGVESLPTPPAFADGEPAIERTDGIAAFLSEWEMNDLLFMVVYENLRWNGDASPESAPWFDVTPDGWSIALRDRGDRAFAVTRVLTGLVFTAIALSLAWRSSRRLDGGIENTNLWVRSAFLTVAWFWMLAPTQNPWYWCWALPLVPWSGSRAWLVMAAAVMAYYLRFWLETAFLEPGIAVTPYDGEHFFYFVVPWLEFGPLLAWLAIEAWLSRKA